MKPVILWLKRDLRTVDHPALCLAATLGPVLPIYIVEPEYWAQEEHSARQWDFIRECLLDLEAQLAQMGLPLVIRFGEAVETLAALSSETGAQILVSHEETGGLWTFERDKAVVRWARSAGVEWREVPQSGVIRRLGSRDGWAHARDRFTDAPLVHPQGLRAPVRIPQTSGLPKAKDLGLVKDYNTRQTGGRMEGLRLLGSFLAGRGLGYQRAMSSPLDGADACSRISPHLAFGTLSVREVARRAGGRAEAIRSGDQRAFLSRLAWRDHFIQKLEDAPDLERRALHPLLDDLRPREPDSVRLQAWANGETGWPFLDACMRSLRATGWLNFRMRSMIMAIASYHLWLDWRPTGRVLGGLFTDFEPGIHWSQCQMQSGVTGINALRVYNPIKQGHDQDPSGIFTRRWVPELANVPDEWLQRPWDWPRAKLTDRYPKPLVDAGLAARLAKDAVWSVRSVPGFRAEAAKVVEKHASRKEPQRRFVRDLVPLPKPKDQGEFDFG